MKKLVMLLLATLFVLCLASCGQNREPQLSDIEYSYADKQFLITAKADIDELIIEYILYDDKGVVINTLSKDVGSVIKDRTYKVNAVPIFIFTTPSGAEIIRVTGKIK